MADQTKKHPTRLQLLSENGNLQVRIEALEAKLGASRSHKRLRKHIENLESSNQLLVKTMHDYLNAKIDRQQLCDTVICALLIVTNP